MSISKIDPAGLDIGQIGGRRNLIINGAMQVAQRGTSSTSNGYVSLDRWFVNQSGASTTFSQETFTAGEEIEQSKYYARLAVSTGNDNAGILHRVEDVTSIPSGGAIVISFWAKGTNPAGGSLSAGYNQNFGSGGSADVGGLINTFTITSNWAKYELVFTNPSYSGKTIGAGSYWQLFFGQGADTSTDAWTLDITNVQLEVGTVATPFEHRSYGEELALCQRYYQTVSSVIAYGAGSTTGIQANIPFMTQMRAEPSVTLNGGTIRLTDSASNYDSSTNPNSTFGDLDGAAINMGGFSGMTQHRPYVMQGSGYGSFHLEAEL